MREIGWFGFVAPPHRLPDLMMQTFHGRIGAHHACVPREVNPKSTQRKKNRLAGDIAS
jgi:hypothetical protein